MKLVTKVKLLPSPEQAVLLLATLECANAACNALSAQAWQGHQFGKVGLQKEHYQDTRKAFSLAAQMTIRCIAKVAGAYKSAKRRRRQFNFHRHGSIAYDARLLSWYPATRTVSIWGLGGRLHVPYTGADWQLALLQYQQGESDLKYQNGAFYLVATCEVEAAELQELAEVLGIDFGIVNLLTDSDGQRHSGSHLNNLRRRHLRLRMKLQKKGTKSARRLLKRRKRKEYRFIQQTNHLLSKQVVHKAERTQRAIALEDLTGIRTRIRATRSQRRQLHSWAFYDLRQKIEYKAERKGIPVIAVDPAYTSQMCSQCGHIARRNRVNQHTFQCASCGHAAHADANAAINIGRRAAEMLAR
jgi:putative transposase